MSSDQTTDQKTDLRVEAVARAAAGDHWLDAAPTWCEQWRMYARKMLAAADAATGSAETHD